MNSHTLAARAKGVPALDEQHQSFEKREGHAPPQHGSEEGSEKKDRDGHGSMGDRGVTRPDMEHHEHGEMSHDDRRVMVVMHHRKTYWIYWTIILLGLWTVSAPFTFGYGDHPVQPADPQAPPQWMTMTVRIQGLIWSDVLSGLLLVVLGWRSLTPGRPVALWGACIVGIWLSAAPLVFWSPSPAAYLNDTLVGALVIGLTVLIPGMPHMIMIMKHGPDRPPGWSYNPSSWPQRGIMIALGFAGWLVSRYLAAYQLGYISTVWEPFFGEGSRRVLTSSVSRAWPISDAGLGAFSYTFEMLMGWMGSPARWRTMPWMVTFFGILVIPLGLTHILLVISQPALVGHWCTLCLLAALIMLPMIPLEVDEVIAMGLFLRQSHREGKPFWRTFWKGGTVEGGGPDERTPELLASMSQQLPASLWGMSVPWTLAASTVLGLWMMFAPLVFGTLGTAAATGSQTTGALVITVAVLAMGEPIRSARFLNVLLGLWLIVAPWVLAGAGTGSTVNSVVAGVLLVGLSIPRGVVRERFGEWDRYVR